MANRLRRAATTLEHGAGLPVRSGNERFPQPKRKLETPVEDVAIAKPIPGQHTGLSLIMQMQAVADRIIVVKGKK